MLGLFAFFYASLHFTTYIWLDQFFDVKEIVKDVVKRPFITIGFAAFVLLIPLAVTSTNAMVRRLGAKRWQNLHRLVYADRRPWRHPLLVAGEKRHYRAFHVCQPAGGLADHPPALSVAAAAGRGGKRVRAPPDGVIAVARRRG